MAITRDLSGNAANAMNSGNGLDLPYNSYNRTNAGTPEGSVTPRYAGEIALDTTNGRYYKAMGLATNTWVALTPA